jgi:hypothetical protein
MMWLWWFFVVVAVFVVIVVMVVTVMTVTAVIVVVAVVVVAANGLWADSSVGKTKARLCTRYGHGGARARNVKLMRILVHH